MELVILILVLLLGFCLGVIFTINARKLPKNVGTLMVIDTDEGFQLFVELNQEIYMFKNEKQVTLDISQK